MTQRNIFTAIKSLALAGAITAAAPALAQGGGDRLITVGLGVQTYVKYPGADDNGVFPMPIFNSRREGEPLPFEAPDEGIGFGILGEDSPFDFGPAFNFQNERSPEDVGVAVDEVDNTIEAGAFAQVMISPNLRLRAEARKGLGGHDGLVGDISADFVLRRGETSVFSIGPRLRLSDGDYQQAYFDVTPAEALRTGLPAYDPGSGIHAVGIAAGLNQMLSRSWGIYAYAGYDRLVGDAADSPLVRTYGSRDQLSGGIGLHYTFRVGGR